MRNKSASSSQYLTTFSGIIFFFFLGHSALAQKMSDIELLLGHKMLNQEEPALPTDSVKAHIGGDVYIYDTIKGVKTVNDSLRVLYVGGVYPNHKISVIVKGKKVNKELGIFQDGDVSHFSGVAIMYEGKPAIVITQFVQLGTRIQI